MFEVELDPAYRKSSGRQESIEVEVRQVARVGDVNRRGTEIRLMQRKGAQRYLA